MHPPDSTWRSEVRIVIGSRYEYQARCTGHPIKADGGEPRVYVDFLGFNVGMDMGFITTFVSPSNPTAQINILHDDGRSALQPNVSIEVEDIDKVFADAKDRGLAIVYPLTEEPWGVRRFFVADPSGTILNIMSHLPS
jgi:catechol 2,3-dioxygenase-like lactoylglutathione lyase family enzyme